MAIVLVPPLMRSLTGGKARVTAPGRSVGQVVANLDAVYPGFRARLCSGDDILPHIGIVVDGEASELGLFQPLEEDSELQFVPAFEGG